MLAPALITLWRRTCAPVGTAESEIAVPTIPGRSSSSPIAPATPVRTDSRRVTPAAGR